LYDIANVLQALNLIEKTSLLSRKPGFKWLGHRGFQTFMSAYKRRTEQVFRVSREGSIQDRLEAKAVQHGLPVKHFKARVLQGDFADCCKSKKLEDACEDSPTAPASANKENVNILNLPPMTLGMGSAFKRLHSFLDTRAPSAFHTLARRVLLESQMPNIAA
jgi:hypothetical protein